MQVNVIQRAFELAAISRSVDEVRLRLRQEGFSNVDAHLAGKSIRADVKRRLIKTTT